jgi:type I restriction enzyme S subunit
MGEIADVVGGGTPRTGDPHNYEGGTIPWITPADLSGYTSKHISNGERNITQKGLSTSSARMLPAGTVLFSSRAPVGYVAIASNPVCTNQGFKSFVLKTQDILPDYVYWWLKGSKELAESLASGTTFLELSGAKAKQIPIPIAPPDQQRLIVAEIEKQFSRLDEAVASLKRVKANLKRYKAAVLKAAVEGKLTEEWRRQHPDVEPASKLLERILAERRAKWKGRGKYKEPVEPDTSNLPSLAEGWRWVSLEQLSWHSSYGTSVKCSYENSGPTVLRIPNIESGKLDFGDLKFAPKSLEIERGEELSVGDVLIIRTNGSRSLIGRSAVVRQPIPSRSTYASYLIRFRLVEQSEVIAWVSTVWDADFFRQWIEQKAATSAGQHNISMTVLGTLPIPLPPLAEQERIVAEVERRLSVIEEIEASVEANLTRADCLRQSILSNAFSGKLKVEKPTKQYV